MRAITVRQPWAWAIIHGGKDIENRSRNIAGSHRGAVAIHVSQTPVPDGDPAWSQAVDAGMDTDRWDGDPLHLGHVIGVVDLVGVHYEIGGGLCCGSPWAMSDHAHLVLANPRPLANPILARGRLGLWTVSDEIEQQIPKGLA